MKKESILICAELNIDNWLKTHICDTLLLWLSSVPEEALAEDCIPSKVVATEDEEPHNPPPGKCIALSEERSLADTGKILGLNVEEWLSQFAIAIAVAGFIGIRGGSDEKTLSDRLLELSLLWQGESELMSNCFNHLTWCMTPRKPNSIMKSMQKVVKQFCYLF